MPLSLRHENVALPPTEPNQWGLLDDLSVCCAGGQHKQTTSRCRIELLEKNRSRSFMPPKQGRFTRSKERNESHRAHIVAGPARHRPVSLLAKTSQPVKNPLHRPILVVVVLLIRRVESMIYIGNRSARCCSKTTSSKLRVLRRSILEVEAQLSEHLLSTSSPCFRIGQLKLLISAFGHLS